MEKATGGSKVRTVTREAQNLQGKFLISGRHFVGLSVIP
jgi:hypothetical protein